MQHPEPAAILTADGSRTLAGAGGEGFKSRGGALAEATHVYLRGSGVEERLAAGLQTLVLEVGFGAGLNFLVTAAAAQSAVAQTAGAQLDYVALELHPQPATALAELRYAELLAPSPLPAVLLAWWAAAGGRPAAGWHVFEAPCVRLRLFVGDATSPAWEEGAAWRAHAVYHDAFSPATLPELWTKDFLTRLAARLEPGGTLVSFCVAGGVRRALAAAGLGVGKRAGPPGGKREVLLARKPAAQT